MIENMQKEAQLLQAKIDQTAQFAVKLEEDSSENSSEVTETNTERSLVTSFESSRQVTQGDEDERSR